MCLRMARRTLNKVLMLCNHSKKDGGKLHERYFKKDITNQSNNAVPTMTFTEEHMSNLLTAYQSLRDLEKLLTIISGIDPENGILCNLRHMDNLIQDLSPLFDPSLDYDQQVYTKVLDDDSLSIPLKAHILLGSKKNGISSMLRMVLLAILQILSHCLCRKHPNAHSKFHCGQHD